MIVIRYVSEWVPEYVTSVGETIVGSEYRQKPQTIDWL